MAPQKSKPIAWLIRHGAVQLEDAEIIVSRTDVPSNPEGERQDEAVLKFLRENAADVADIYSSPLVRCLDTAREFAGDRPVMQDRGLLPWARGILTGTAKSEAEPIIKVLLANPSVRVPMGESRIEAEQRILEFFEPTLAKAESRPAAFFTHHTVIDFLSYLLKGERPDDPPNILDVGGVAAVYVDGDGYRIEALLNGVESESLDAVS